MINNKITKIFQYIGLVTIVCLFLFKIEASKPSDSVPTWNANIILTEPVENCSPWQLEILIEYEKSKDEQVKARNAFILSNLWEKGLLENDIKDFLVEQHYKLVLIQSYGNYSAPNWQVQCQHTFPFPDKWVSFTPTLYKNEQVEWAPDKPQKEHAMSQNSSIITSLTGGKYINGDVIYYSIKIEEKDKEKIVWEKTVKTNQVVLRGLENRHNVPVLKNNVENVDQ